MKLKDLGEIGLIERFRRKTPRGKGVVKGIGDDTAVIAWTKDKYLLFTCDMLIEGTHFTLESATPFQIGWKAMARNISDIAAMGGVPRYALVSAALNKNASVKFADEIYRGLNTAAKKFGINIVGGDTSTSEKIALDVSLIGEVAKKGMVYRSGARKGDLILVTGSIGGSIKGRHLNFIPRLRESQYLTSNFKLNSMIDISDGLLLDLKRILKASGVGATIYRDSVPISKDADEFESAVSDGEDFELLFTASLGEARRIIGQHSKKIKTAITIIGEVTDVSGDLSIVNSEGKKFRIKEKGYEHFAKDIK